MCGLISFYCVLENLKESSDSSGLDHFFGLLGGLLVGTSGHRPGVILNLTTEDFENCKEGQDGYAIFVSVLVVIVFFHICLFKYSHILIHNYFTLQVKNHKTCKTFGHAIVPVTKKEYKCMSEFQKLRNKFEGSHSAHFFF